MKLQRTSRLAAVLAAGSLALAACGSDEEVATPTPDGSAPAASEAPAESALSGTISGAGSSAQGAAMEGWIAGFQTTNPDVTINYDPVGSGGGREQFLAGGVPFAGSDAALDEEELVMADERCGDGGLVEVPLYISPIAVAFNLPGIKTLNLSAATIAGVGRDDWR